MYIYQGPVARKNGRVILGKIRLSNFYFSMFIYQIRGFCNKFFSYGSLSLIFLFSFFNLILTPIHHL